MSTMQKDRILQLRGEQLYDREGDKIGTVEEIYLDADTGAPEWALVGTGLFGNKSTFVPVREAIESGGELRVPYDKATVKNAPRIDPDGQLSRAEEDELYRHYGLEDVGMSSGTGGTVGRDVSGPETDDAMTRSEEELRVGKAERETGRARLRKYVVTENVTQTVPVQREELRVEREPITDANRGAATSGADISEEEHEVVLHQEEVVVDKRAVPKERVRLDKDTVTEQREVSEDVRKEQVELLDAQGEPARGADGVRGTDDGVTR
jgi:uncharacterized protein (TIGR02271 family)